MNEQLQTALTDLINKSLAGVDATKDFLVDEIPDVVQQLLWWHGIYNFILFLFGILYFFSIFSIVLMVYRKNKEGIKQFDGEEVFFFSLFGPIFLFIIFLPVLFTMNLTWFQIWIAPKVWLLEYATRLFN